MLKNAKLRKIPPISLVLFLTAAVGLLAQTVQPPLIYSQVGSGIVDRTAFRTVFRISNEDPQPIPGLMEFTSLDGSSFQVQPTFRWSVDQSSSTGIPVGARAVVQGSRIDFVIPTGHTLEIVIEPHPGVALGRAVVDIAPQANVQAFLQFAAVERAVSESDFEARLIREVQNHPVQARRSFSFPVSHDPTAALSSAVAITNLSAAEADVNLVLRPDLAFHTVVEPNGTIFGFLSDLLGAAPISLNGDATAIQVLEVNSDAPLGVAVFRTRDGLPLSGVTVTRIPPEFSASAATRLGEEFELVFGEAASIEEEQLQVAAVNLLEDSRCPTGVDCVWEGQATVEIRLTKNGQDLGSLRLTSRAGAPDMAEDSLGEYVVELLEVSPYPNIQTIPIKISDYRLRLRVTRAD